MKRTIVVTTMLMLMLLQVGGCYFAVGGYGWDRDNHDHDGYYRDYNSGNYHGDNGYDQRSGGSITGVEKTLGDGGMTGIDDASMGCIL